MRKEFVKMYGYAVAKIAFAVAMAVLAYMVIFRGTADVEPFGKVICSLCWGAFCLVYFVSGVRTILLGTKQAKEYMETTGYNEARLEEEYENATNYGRIRVGAKHVFANASNGFYVIPIVEIETAYFYYHKYTYVYIKAQCFSKKIKMYYLSKKKAEEAVQSILWRMKENGSQDSHPTT